ncbi:MarR family transcriptional regulator [Cohnella massiliensis]|uniref:MarR family transcriptional regulator n=1 Tax=Cohnella massiliensis TaxID=1816691 RepID=UPI0009BABBCA|nr:MarR family transcriptional regulator [Cohnella massiliensis]
MEADLTLRQLIYGQFIHFMHLNEQRMEVEFREFADKARELNLTAFPNNLTSIHVIDCIGNNEPINNTSVAGKLNLSKASITKISAKLLEEGFIKRSRLNDNKKEVYFSLTPKGKEVLELHETLHGIQESKFLRSLNSFSETELHTILKFFQTMISHWNANPLPKGAKNR